ncbi:MAG: cell division ATP-binding protein FtsE [Tractidigestivibacter sp.]|uniref:cell division ATP-binding protein FtsE n=1 Tax=Tractidigestivibacter sp. TaxID=2847320 RepID=UPI003D9448E5
MASHFRTSGQPDGENNLPNLDATQVPEVEVAPSDTAEQLTTPDDQATDQTTTEEDRPLEEVHVVTASEPADDTTQDRPYQSVYESLKNEEPAPTTPHTGTPTIEFKDVTLIYPAQPNKPALENVSVDIYPGEFVFIVGHSGSGKSSFLRLVTRELKATSGQVLVAGQDLTKMRNSKVPYLRRQIGTVYQDFKLLPDKTVYENVAFALECIGKPRAVIRAQVPEVLRLVGLAEKQDNYPDQLSGGEQQRVSVARAMVNRPPLLICDEPTGNLDPAISLGIMKLLDRINREGTTVVMATHDREMVDSMRKRVIALEAGHVVRDQERGGYGYYGAL